MMNKETTDKLSYLKEFAEEQLKEYIMPFWRNRMEDKKYGGFYGRIEDDLTVDKTAEKGLVLNARILWTFSKTFAMHGEKQDLALAEKAYDYILKYFYDKESGGFYWSLNYDGTPLVRKKQIYAQAFTIYSFCEYFKVTGKKEVLQNAIDLFQLIEEHAFDKKYNGYIEACDRDWKESTDLKLSGKDLNEKKGMNTHLHVLEAYTNLYNVWKNDEVKKQLENMILLFLDKIIDPKDNHLILFFDEHWNPKSSLISYGHDIETSWLLHEAAIISGNNELIKRSVDTCLRVTRSVLQGWIPEGAILYEDDRQGKHHDHELEWWAQAEAVVGFLNSYTLEKDPVFLDSAYKIAHFIDAYIVDKKNGEWYFRVNRQGIPIKGHEKAGFWKCPYHNTRACYEILHRYQSLTE